MKTLDELVNIAILSNNVTLLKFIFEQGYNDVEACFKLVEKRTGSAIEGPPVTKDIMNFLIEKIETSPKKSMVRPLIIHKVQKDMATNWCHRVNNNSTLMLTVIDDPAQAERDLDSGIVSLEEINYRNNSNFTVLLYLSINACKIENSISLIQKLIVLGADVNLCNNSGSTPLMYACRHSNEDSKPEVVDILLAHPKIDVNIKNDGEGMNAFEYACSYVSTTSSIETVKKLLQHPQIDVNVRDMILDRKTGKFFGQTVLMRVSFHSANPLKLEIMKLLLAREDIDINATCNTIGVTALGYLLKNTKLVIPKFSMNAIQMLIAHPKMDWNVKCHKGKTVSDYLIEELRPLPVKTT